MNPRRNSYGTLTSQNSFDQETAAVVTEIPYRKKSFIFKLKSTHGSIAISATLLGALLVFIVFAAVPQQDSFSLNGHSNAVMLRILRADNDIIETTTSQSSRGGGNSTREPTVRISQGILRGKILQSRAGRDYNAFYTIPYGKPPIGNLRFQPPEAAEPWSGTRDATQKGPMCIQQERYNPNKNIVGSEDCLYLHLFSPKLPQRQGLGRRNQNQTNTLPVIAYFFGGGFMHGTANDFSGDYFMDEDVIIVLIESRVGALGFLNTEDLAATGNQGLKDQSLAMKWIKQNIDRFGGNPNKIVAFGTSSGASCSQAHLLSPMNAGIISGVMSFSGYVMSSVMFDFNPRKPAVELGKALNCSDLEDSFNLVKCLQNASAIDIGYYQTNFGPSVETIPLDGNMTNIFLPDTPTNLLKTGNFNKVPWLTGVNSAEAILQSYTLLLNPTEVDNLNENWDNEIAKLLQFKDNSEKEYSKKMHQFYFGDQKVSNDTRYNLTNLMSDRMFVHPASLSSKLITEHNSTVFLYYLTKEANVSWAAEVTQYFDPPNGVSHADEVQYFFPRPRYPYIPLDSEYAAFSKMLVKFWVTFADKGTPIGPVDWPPVNKNDAGFTFYNLDDEPRLVQPVTERMQFWNSLPLEVFY